MDWLYKWFYRKRVTLSRASGAVTDYQMKLLVGESSGAIGADVDCGGLCNSSFSDIRFTTSGTELLDYWIESITGATPNQLATVWIEFDSIGTDDTVFYMYYGNAEAEAYSNGDDTFIFFDHFDEDLSKWSGSTAYASISNSILSMTGPNAVSEIFGNVAAGSTTFAARFLGKIGIAVGTYDVIGVAKSDASHRAGIYGNSNTRLVITKDGATESTDGSDWTANSFELWDILVSGSSSARFLEHGVELTGSPKTTNPPNSADMRAWFLAYKATSVCQADWVLLRKWLTTEPVFGPWGDAEWRVYYFSGYVYEQGVSAADRVVRAYNRSTGELVAETTSSGNGYYYLETTYSGAHYIICLDDDALPDFSDLIRGRIYPEEVV